MRKINRRGFLKALGIGAVAVPTLGSISKAETVSKQESSQQSDNYIDLGNSEWMLNIKTNVNLKDKDLAIEIQDSDDPLFNKPRTAIAISTKFSDYTSFTKGSWLFRSRLPHQLKRYLRINIATGNKRDIQAWLEKYPHQPNEEIYLL